MYFKRSRKSELSVWLSTYATYKKSTNNIRSVSVGYCYMNIYTLLFITFQFKFCI